MSDRITLSEDEKENKQHIQSHEAKDNIISRQNVMIQQLKEDNATS